MKRGSSLSRGSGAQLSDSWDMACMHVYHTQPEKDRDRERKRKEGGRGKGEKYGEGEGEGER